MSENKDRLREKGRERERGREYACM